MEHLELLNESLVIIFRILESVGGGSFRTPGRSRVCPRPLLFCSTVAAHIFK